MNYCDHCDRQFSNPRCPRCGALPAPRGRDHDDTGQDRPIVSDPPDSLVEQHSRPTLASLVRAGLRQGIIHVLPEYVAGKKRA